MASTDEKLNYIVEVVDKATKDIARIKNEIASLSPNVEKANKAVGGLNMSFGKLTGAFAAGTLIAQGVSSAVGFLASQITQSISAATQYQSVMMGLNSTAAAFGVNQSQARDAVKSLTEDGLITQATAANGLQKLFQSGLNLQQAIDLMGAYKDQAAFGRVQTLSFDQAVGNLAESFMTENAMIGNLSGQTENYSLIIGRGAAIMGKQESQLTQTERTMAKYLGTMQLAEVVQGDTARAAETLAGAQAKLDTAILVLQQNIGSAFTPAMQIAIDIIYELVTAFNNALAPSLEGVAKFFVNVVGVVGEAAARIAQYGSYIVDMIRMIGDAGNQLKSLNFSGAFDALSPSNSKKQEIDDKWNGVVDSIKSKVTAMNEKISSQGLGAFPDVIKNQASKVPDMVKNAADKVAKEAERLAQKLKDIAEDTAKAIDDYTHSVDLRTADFQRNLEDLVIRHRDAIRQLRADIDELNRDFADAATERSSDHEDRKNEIIAKYEEETAVLKDNLARRLADNTGSDEQLVAYFQALIAKKDAARDAELAKEDERYKKEETKQQASLQKRINELQSKLNEELEIQKKHQADFDAVKDKAAEDDITRLKNSFAREMEELKRQHNERMEELRKQQEEILALKAANDAKAAKSVASSAQSRSVSYTLPKTTPLPAPRAGYYGPAFQTGGVVPGNESEAVPILAHGSEMVLNRTQQEGLIKLLEKVASGVDGGGGQVIVNQTNNIKEEVDMKSAFREVGWRLSIR